MISHVTGVDEFHTAEIRTIEEAREIYRVVRDISKATA